jgi:hypothetical protein
MEIGCRVAQNICVSKYACIGVLEPGASELSYFASCGAGMPVRQIARPRAPACCAACSTSACHAASTI